LRNGGNCSGTSFLHTDEQMAESDPIRKRYYRSVEWADRATDWLFYVGAALSFASLVVSQRDHPRVYGTLLLVFAIAVLALFVTGMVARLYFTPRAEHKRRQDFLTEAFGVSLTHENAVGYYNNDFTDPPRKLAAQLLENSYFSKELVLRIAHEQRIKAGGYFLIWLILVLNRQTEFGVILAASQAVFSEQLLSKAIRVDWFRSKCEKVHDDVYRLFQSDVAADRFLPQALESLLLYETAKSNAAVVIPSKLFERMNPELSREWDAIRARLQL
jgi:hypothetical protein